MALQTMNRQYPIGRFSSGGMRRPSNAAGTFATGCQVGADRGPALPDYRAPVAHALDLLDALHRRWVGLLRSLDWPQWQRVFVHPESGPATLAVTVGSYAWHGRHHLAHVERLIAREGWTRPA